MSDPRATLEAMVASARTGDADAGAALDERLYSELRALAASMMRSQPVNHTLQPTALVHEAFLKMDEFVARMEVVDRAHLFRAIAKAMRQLLIDSARRKATEKHGGGRRRSWSRAEGDAVMDAEQPRADPEMFVQLSDAVDRLAEEDLQAAEVVRLKVFAGCTMAQIAEVLGISERTAHREWDYARRWLRVRLTESEDEPRS